MDYYTNISRYGSNILATGYENGEKVLRKDRFSPTLYTLDTNSSQPYRTIHNEPLVSSQFNTMREASDFVKQTVDTNLKVYGNTNFVYQYIVEHFPDGISGINSSMMNVCHFDLEMDIEDIEGFPHPEKAEAPIMSGTFHFSKTNEFIVLGLKNDYTPNLPNVTFTYCNSELTLLSKIIQLFHNHNPDIISGWNIRLFDVPYLVHRIDKLLGEGQSSRLSPWNKISQKSIFIKGKENLAYDIVGVSQLDYLDLWKKFSINTFGQLENNRLDTVANVVLGENKLHVASVDQPSRLAATSDCVNVDPNKAIASLEPHEKLCLLKDKLREEKKKRGL